MKYRKRRYFTAAEIAVIWDRWEKGESLNAIARDLGRSHSTIEGLLARNGGRRHYRACKADAYAVVAAGPKIKSWPKPHP